LAWRDDQWRMAFRPRILDVHIHRCGDFRGVSRGRASQINFRADSIQTAFFELGAPLIDNIAHLPELFLIQEERIRGFRSSYRYGEFCQG